MTFDFSLRIDRRGLAAHAIAFPRDESRRKPGISFEACVPVWWRPRVERYRDAVAIVRGVRIGWLIFAASVVWLRSQQEIARP